jgi:hypothetical protein
MSEPRFPNLLYAWRMPVRALSWRLAWWLMGHVTLRGYTRLGQARMISEALGAYRPEMPPGYLAPGYKEVKIREGGWRA